MPFPASVRPLHPALVLLLALAAPQGASSGSSDAPDSQPTFYRDVLPILQQHCQECHRPAGTNYGGLLAPMSLVEYGEVRPWAKSIAKRVERREMPPWDAALEHQGVFLNERILAPEEIATLVRWAAGGAPAGDPEEAPPARHFDNVDGWMIGEPDLVVTIPEEFWVGDDVEDLYTAFSVDLSAEQLPEDMWITAFQCKPSIPIIHHFNAHLLAPDADGRLPAPPEFPSGAQIAPDPARAGRYIGGTASGTDAIPYPEGFGLRIEKGTRVTFDIHYHKEPGPGTGMWDRRSQIGFKLTRKPPTREIGGGTNGVGPLAIYRFEIPPGVERFQLGPASRTFQAATDLIGLMPHMHLRGKAARFEAFYPDGTREVLLDVPDYDFSWQTNYRYRELKRVPAGTRVEFTAWYDNSAERAARYGFDPTATVTFGPASTDEMMMGFITHARAVD